MLLADLSNNNPTVDFRRLARAGVRGVYLKATEGATFVDPTFAARRTQARAAGLAVGAYHFARPDTGDARLSDAHAEARHFASVVGRLGWRDLRPALDLEIGRPEPRYVAWSRAWNTQVRDLLGAGPLFYSYPYYIVGLRAAEPIGYGLWLADYGRDDGAAHPAHVPAPWQKCVLHQYTSNGRVDGVSGRCDLNRAERMRPLFAFPARALASAPAMLLRRLT